MSHVAAQADGRIGRLRLDRPRALNALDAGMIADLDSALRRWADDPAVHAVTIEGNERAYCAGGDIRAVRDWVLAGDHAAVAAYFRAEYALNLRIARYKKPVVALVDGLCLGGGMGIAVHGSHRVATEAASFAMPETAIGFCPDIGASYVLPRLPGGIGMAMGLTGWRLMGADAVHAGLATHFVPRDRLTDLQAALREDGVAAIAGFAAPLPARSYDRVVIDSCFLAPDLPGILARLEQTQGVWPMERMAALRAASPAAVLWTEQLLRAGARRSLAQCLRAEWRLVRQITRLPDFAEGVRAMVVDKDRQPRWSFKRIETVDPALLRRLFDTPAQPSNSQPR